MRFGVFVIMDTSLPDLLVLTSRKALLHQFSDLMLINFGWWRSVDGKDSTLALTVEIRFDWDNWNSSGKE